MDATEAASSARKYFNAIGNPLGFSVESAEPTTDGWRILCSLWEFFGASDRSTFELLIDAQSGAVLRVKKLSTAP